MASHDVTVSYFLSVPDTRQAWLVPTSCKAQGLAGTRLEPQHMNPFKTNVYIHPSPGSRAFRSLGVGDNLVPMNVFEVSDTNS
jgi:hypothetical protein